MSEHRVTPQSSRADIVSGLSRKAVLFAPFWRQPGHIGNNRVERFVRWLAEDGYQVIVIRGGSADSEQSTPWGLELTVRDPAGLYRDNVAASGFAPQGGNPLKKWLKAIGHRLLNPDPSIIWARRAMHHPRVHERVQGAAFILSSSPPESPHVGASYLARKFAIPHIVDMRDGWLDEPLKPLLKTSALRRWQEGRLEARILAHARAILVTSTSWKQHLCTRFPAFADKISEITNGYPASQPDSTPPAEGQPLILMHTGRFSASDSRRTPEAVLLPLLEALQADTSSGQIRLIGALSAEENGRIDGMAQDFARHHWRIERTGNIPRAELLQELTQAHGLLLVSSSQSALPSKLFEYIPTRRPILAVTEAGSATGQLCRDLPQAFVVEPGRPDIAVIRAFLSASRQANPPASVPEQYGEPALRETFRKVIRQL